MRQVNLGKYSAVRIWTGELPNVIVPVACQTSVVLPARNNASMPRELAIEFSAGFSERSPYGLLGGIFTPANTGQLKVVIGSDANGCKATFSSPLKSSSEKIYIGLPREYADAANHGVCLAQEWTDVAAGQLTINRGAHSNTRSSPWLFQHLTTILIRLLNTPLEDMTDEKIRSVFGDGMPASNA